MSGTFEKPEWADLRAPKHPLAVPVERRADVVTVFLVAAAFVAGLAGGVGYKARVITHTRVTHTGVNYGTPTQSIDGARVNSSFAGLTCDVYQPKRTVVCHP